MEAFTSGYKWIIFVALFGGAAYKFYLGYKQGRSGSVTGYDNRPSDMNAKFFQCPQNWYGIGFVLLAIGIAFWMYHER
jgi:hypothetical protein